VGGVRVWGGFVGADWAVEGRQMTDSGAGEWGMGTQVLN
jgi:hypothetical protein